ncbi:macrolide family glycosyltransferase [Nocardiopsis kunsanensis]|uniref:macrolide family glycosyltransferase n=1 Tax=Nocardiopsis kunsanensis TaxID=141693 RepID=UPI0003477B69|nr:macrolide family glycosyltransferase [Nocardiopsis kunsanensis]
MAHIAFTCLPASGHINPTLAVVAELVARGHRVTYATSEDYAARVREAGATAVVCPSSLDLARDVAPFGEPDRYTTDALVRVLRTMLAEAVATLPAIARAFSVDRPDVLVYDHPSSWAGRIVADTLEIPAIGSRPTMAENAHWSMAAHTDFRRDPALTEVFTAVQRLLTRVGARINSESFLLPEDLPCLVYLPRAFQNAGDTFDPDVHFVGPCLRERPFLGTWSSPSDDRPLLLVSLGTVYNGRPDFFRTCVAAFAPLPWNVVFTLGDGVDFDALRPLPEHVQVYRFLPHLDVLRTADAFLNHGGTGTVMEGLANGVPVIAVPRMAEHRVTAERLAELGAGTWIAPEEVTSESLRRAVTTATEDSTIRERAGDMRRLIREAGGAPAAADAIEARLPARNPTRTGIR